MITVNYLRENKHKYLDGLSKRNFNDGGVAVVEKVIHLDDQRKSIETELNTELSKINLLSREIGELLRSGKTDKAELRKVEVAQVKDQNKYKESSLKEIRAQLHEHLFNLPNLVHESVPKGTGESDNEVVKDFGGTLPELDEQALPHWDLADKFHLIDFKTGAKLTGSGFPVFLGKGAKLQRALVSYFLDRAIEAGYDEYTPPLLVNEDSARGTGQLPDKEGQMYWIEKDNLYLIPTAEVPVTNIYRDVILKESDLPVKMTAYTPCFRREAGSYGSDVKGLNRVHQFDKVEIVQIQHPDQSYRALDDMVRYVEGLLIALELPYRILRLCGGDLGFASALTYDFEVYSAAQKRWLEVSSVSNFESFQSNRMKLRFKDESNRTKLVHTLNGSALALPRVIAAILENNQTGDSITIPEVLRNYTGFQNIQ